jgi:hypothetical protein
MIHLKYECKVNFVKLPLISIYLLTYGAEPFLRSCQLCSPSRTPQHFMEPKGSIIWIYRCLKMIFENTTAGRNTGCRSVVNPPHPARHSYRSSVEITRTLWWQTRFTRGCVGEWKSGHNSVTVQNRTHVYMNFFGHKDLGNHLLQLRPKVVKHPVYVSCFTVQISTFCLCNEFRLILTVNS